MQRIIYVQYTNPAAYPPLEHSSRILAQDGWRVLFLGTGGMGAHDLQFPFHTYIAVRLLAFCPAGWRQKIHYLWFCIWVIGWVLRWRPAWVYASEPLSCPIALLLSFVPGLCGIYHEHDSPDIDRLQSDQYLSIFIRSVFWARRHFARRAKQCILPNQQRIARFISETGVCPQHTICVWNCPANEEIGSPRDTCTGEIIRVLYHGSIVPARLPPTVLTALAMLPGQVVLRIVGYETIGHQGYLQHLREYAQQLGIDHRVEFIGAVPTRMELFAHCRSADIGLALMPTQSQNINEQTMLSGASNKPFDYLACGLALLVPNVSDWCQMYVKPSYGLACDPDDPPSMAAALRWLAEHPSEMRAMGERGRQRILSEWNYETQFAKVYQELY